MSRARRLGAAATIWEQERIGCCQRVALRLRLAWQRPTEVRHSLTTVADSIAALAVLTVRERVQHELGRHLCTHVSSEYASACATLLSGSSSSLSSPRTSASETDSSGHSVSHISIKCGSYLPELCARCCCASSLSSGSERFPPRLLLCFNQSRASATRCRRTRNVWFSHFFGSLPVPIKDTAMTDASTRGGRGMMLPVPGDPSDTACTRRHAENVARPASAPAGSSRAARTGFVTLRADKRARARICRHSEVKEEEAAVVQLMCWMCTRVQGSHGHRQRKPRSRALRYWWPQ